MMEQGAYVIKTGWIMIFTQNRFIAGCTCGLSILPMVCSCSDAKTQEKPNIVLFIADDVSLDDIGCYGNREVKTPNIDRLAASGIKFTNMFLTASSSSPSRNSIITGRYPHNTGGAELHTNPPDLMISFPEIHSPVYKLPLT